MAEYTLTKDVAGTSKDNEQVRTISSFFSYVAATHKTISLITRRDGIWCSCGGTSQTVEMEVYDQLFAGTTLIKTSDTATCKCKGSGPSDENYATTTFDNWTQSESNAAVAAWAAGTLTIKRFVTITKASSSSHGTPTFRDGQYSDTIVIKGNTVPFTNYRPVILYFDAFRSSNGSTENVESATVYAKIKLGLTDVTGALADSPKLILRWSGNGQSGDMDITDAFVMVAENIGIQKTICLGSTWLTGADWNLTLEFSAGEEISDPAEDVVFRAAIPIHISETNNGVAIGQYSSATSSEQKFECNYPAYFYKGIIGTGYKDGDTESITRGFFDGYATTSAKEVFIRIPLFKSLENINSITCSKFKASIANSGGYGLTTSYADGGGDYTSLIPGGGITFCPVTNTVYIKIARSTAFKLTNNNNVNCRVVEIILTFHS